MNERNKQFRVGVVAVATVVITAILIAWHSDFSSLPFSGNYQLKVVADQAPGVSPNTPVRRRGILIGRVEDVEPTDEGAVITLNINQGREVKSNERARIVTSLIGDATIEFVPMRPSAGSVAFKPGEEIEGMYVPSPVDMLGDIQGDLKQTIQALGQAGSEVAQLAERLNTVLGENDLERVTRMVESLDSALVEFRETMTNVNKIVGDEKLQENLREGLAQLPSLVEDARAIMQGLERVAGSADENLKNLTGLTKPLGERGDRIVASMEQSVTNLQELLGNVAELSANINNSQGTIGLLIRDRELYDKINAAASDAQGMIADVRALVSDEFVQRRIRMILDNIWVLTDKLQRDPARALRGVVNRETPLNAIQR
ncbi:MAG: MCE family protein [Pirellulales bacterium]|nr:MCE family protein [Pirellulales bacterium]